MDQFVASHIISSAVVADVDNQFRQAALVHWAVWEIRHVQRICRPDKWGERRLRWGEKGHRARKCLHTTIITNAQTFTHRGQVNALVLAFFVPKQVDESSISPQNDARYVCYAMRHTLHTSLSIQKAAKISSSTRPSSCRLCRLV